MTRCLLAINPALLPNDLDALRELRDALADQLAAVDAAIWEMGEAAGNAELRGLRRDYFASVIGRN